jgi:4-carboxymuconolactone decarboxylase
VNASGILGITKSDLARVKQGPSADGWEPLEAAVLSAVDELHREARIRDETWSVLAAHWNDQQLIEFPFLVGEYQALAYALNSLGIDVPGMDDPVT